MRVFLEIEVPGGTYTDVVVAVAIPVVDVEAVLVEVADTRDVASVDLRLVAYLHLDQRESNFTVFANLYTLFSVFI